MTVGVSNSSPLSTRAYELLVPDKGTEKVAGDRLSRGLSHSPWDHPV